MPKLIAKERFRNREIVHFADQELVLSSRAEKIFVETRGEIRTLTMPKRWWETLPGRFRLMRRALRLDKCNVVPTAKGLVAIRGGQVYFFKQSDSSPRVSLRLRNCRNVLHQSICTTPEGAIYFGEYGANPERRPVPIYRSSDAGGSWETIFEFPAGKIKHVHGCYFDPIEDSLWVCTGDFEGECWIIRADREFSSLEWIGNGSQLFRTCSFFFRPDAVHWLMDSQLSRCHHVRLDRASRTATAGDPLPGPVWYSKQLTDGYLLAGTAQEVGPGVQDRYAHLMVSRDLSLWKDLCMFSHDGWPMRYFKSGVLGFADGAQDSTSFFIFGEALRGFDGQTMRCALEDAN